MFAFIASLPFWLNRANSLSLPLKTIAVNYLTLENVTKTYGEKILFQNISLTVNKGQKVALIAKNGTGKSTLLRVIAGIEAPEGENCKILLRRDVKVGYLEQDPDLYHDHSVLEAVLDADTPIVQTVKSYERAILLGSDPKEMQALAAKMDDLKAWDFEARVKELLSRFSITDYNQTIGSLSGGQRKRVALVKLILDEPEFIILDEPTNHLDLDMIEWLEEYLRNPNLTVFMVTHDRYFLERVCNQIVELERGQLYKYSGNYADFLDKKMLRRETEAAEMEKMRKLYKRELDWVRRSPSARSTKAKSRVDAFYDIEDKVSQRVDNTEMQIEIKGQRLGKKVLELDNVCKSYGDRKIVDDFTYKFMAGERIGVVGPNGIGKSTFLRLITKEERPSSGKITIGGNTVFGFYTQEGIVLKSDKRVIDVIQDIAEFIPLEKGQKLTAPQLLERFLFTRPQQQVYVSQLSGGERRRLYLLTILMQNPNFLILDEPTNDLDIVTLNVLEDFLLEYPGCVIIVTHDRYFMDKIVDHLFVFEGDGRIKDFNGDYTEYRETYKQKEREQKRQEKAGQAQSKQTQALSQGLSYEERKELNRIEKEISRLEERKVEIENQFASPDIQPERIAALAKELAEVKEAIEEKEFRWMELAEKT